ncbi:MAG: protein phosphatase 2C domain-containing protein, partial [Sphingobacteriales bacterium]
MGYKIAQVIIQGHSHKKSDPIIPCQDFGKAGTLNNGFHVIIVSDGAGSSKYSHIASEFCVNTLYTNVEIKDFSEFVEKPIDIDAIQLKWKNFCLNLFSEVRSALLEKAKLETIQTGDLNCTLILIIKTQWGFLCANIGDGRSGFSDGQPRELIVPFMTYT